MAIDYHNRKVIVDHILDKEFLPLITPKMLIFANELLEKRIEQMEWKRHIGIEIATPPTILDLTPELTMLSNKLCRVFELTETK